MLRFAFQLAVLIGLLSLSGPLLDLSMDNPAEQTELFTLVFNSLVMMSLFNQVRAPSPVRHEQEGERRPRRFQGEKLNHLWLPRS